MAVQQSQRTFFANKVFVTIFVLILCGAAAAFLKIDLFGTTHSGDYDNYVNTAQYLLGQHVDTSGLQVAGRLLKPLYPALLALMSSFMSFESAALLQSIFFYLCLIVALFFLGMEFFDNHFSAILFVALSAFSYPVLKYGIDVYSETGSWLTYIVSLYLTLRFLRRPSTDIFLWNVAVITFGFLWKEYVIVAAIIFGLALLFHSALTVRQKMYYLGAYALLFLLVQIPWQIYIFSVFHTSYLDWYVIAGTHGFSYQFTLKNIVKSTAALIGLMWLFVPMGFRQLKSAPSYKRFFALLSTPVPFIGYAWGFISSRLLYVIAPPMLLVALAGIERYERRTQIGIAILATIANFAWLALSYRYAL